MSNSQFSPYQNTQPYAQQARQPRAIVLVNNIPALWEEIEITTTTFYNADNYHVQLPLNGQNSNLNLNYWATTQNFTIQIYVGFPSNPYNYSTSDLDLIIEGDCDELEVDPLSARVMLSGRDLTSRFIDTKTTNKYPNQTSSQIAAIFAAEHGLMTNITPTFTPVGSYYNSQNVLMSKVTTEWDLLCYLANQENYFVYVKQNVLYFNPKTYDLSNVYTLQYQAPTPSNASPTFNGMRLGLFRSTTLSSDVSVTIKIPYNINTGKADFVRASSTHRSRAYLHNVPAPSGKVQKYSFVMPGLTKQQAQQKANQILQDITLHEVRLTAYIPGNNILQKNGAVQLKGTNTAYDQLYYIEQIVRRINVPEGYNMEISAKNQSTDTEITL